MFNIKRDRLIQWLGSLTYDRSINGRHNGYKWKLDGIALDIVDGNEKDLLTYQFTITDMYGKTKQHILTYERWFTERRDINTVYLATIIIEHSIKSK